MLSCSIWFSAPSFWMGGGVESRCVGRVYGAVGARHHPQRTHNLHGTPYTRRKPYAATQHLMLLMMGYVTETFRAKNTPIKLPRCIKLAFHFISQGNGCHGFVTNNGDWMYYLLHPTEYLNFYRITCVNFDSSNKKLLFTVVLRRKYTVFL